MTIKSVEFCPGFGELAKGSDPYSGKKFIDPTITARNSDPIYDSVEEVQPVEEREDPSDSQPGIY